MRSKLLGALLAVIAALAAVATPAGAVVANTPNGRVGYLPLNEAAVGNGAAPNGLSVPGSSGTQKG
ncbi:MAG: hypothetical protein ACRDQZ_16610, partial [Mycobacteriales bacterium]